MLAAVFPSCYQLLQSVVEVTMARPPELETKVLEALWTGGHWSVREVMKAVDNTLAYTTFATVLHRLYTKGAVIRSKVEGAWSYSAAQSRHEALADEVGRVLERANGAPEPLLVAFLDQVEQVDPAALDRLEALIQARRGGK